ncbi:NAD-dependent succinate-semialdehyde dehydrogenase [Flexivirga oryzae]|uniref:Succinate-semialdehyde dehydrogenase/glutarate-semialdehyde dehydrogenase n=1 Tax=Flexivirga oryzae TaxID=1794944 RepID=A0A839N7W5_9MICO|nr:NAD-dependent succinate-semialdehyde dehydrogenase [Flexivirga oryzae]MBB2893848.1 succinate-semialdehyde dehydrogenase/glutarate-semialdehyde dehydrogenase [Flexivirga oryzae]
MSVKYAVTNPATGQIESTFPTATDNEIADVLARTGAAYASWRQVPVEERAAVLGRVSDLYLERQDELALLITREMGKPLSQALWELGLVADIYRYYADQGPGFLLETEFNPKDGGHAVIRKESMGSLLGIMPWNFPYYQVCRFAGPNLVAGNAIVIKHAPQCPESSKAIEEIFHDAGLPADAYINVFASNEQVATMIADPRIAGVSVTGSERAGSAVAEVAGRHLKKVILELGGSDPFVVLDSDDLAKTVQDAVLGRIMNAGQACTSSKRMIVVDDLYDEFVAQLAKSFDAVEVGDPTSPDTEFGPMSSQGAVDSLMSQIDDAIAHGAEVRAGGGRVEGPGCFVRPTVLTGITPAMRAYREELFGPVALVFRVADADEAAQLANGTEFGLGASVYSSDPAKAAAFAARLDTGMVWINSPESSAADLPFGGTKRSGIGRELGSLGIDEFVNKKTIYTPAATPLD